MNRYFVLIIKQTKTEISKQKQNKKTGCDHMDR